MKPICFLVLFSVLLASCAPSPSQIQEVITQTQAAWTIIPTNTPFSTYTPVPTYTAFPTYTPQPTIAIEVTRIVMVTPTYTSTPQYTPTDTSTPTNTPNPTQTAEAYHYAQLIADKGNGFYLVNVDIAPGIWRSTGTEDGCYWSLTDVTGDILDNHFGMAGGTVYIASTVYQVEFNDCGTFTYLSPP